MVHKILPIDNASLFLSRFKYSRSHSEIEFNLWSSCIWIQKKMSKLHIAMKSLFKALNATAIKQEMVFPRNSRSLQKIFFSMRTVYFSSWRTGENQTFLENTPRCFVSQGKSSKIVLVMKLTESSAEHLQQNFACLPPQHPENSPVTNCLEENTFSPVQSALKFARCDQQSKILPLCWSFSFPQRLNGLNAPSIDCLNPGHGCLLLFASLHRLLSHFHHL